MLNKVFLIGNLGADLELKETGNGTPVTEMSVATSFGDKTEWHRVVVWDKQAENAAKYLHKGSKVHVEGRLQTRSYEDKEGNKRYVTEIVAQFVTFLDSKADKAEEAPAKGKRTRGQAKSEPLPDDDLPF